LQGRRVDYSPPRVATTAESGKPAAEPVRELPLRLYFIEGPDWVVNVRVTGSIDLDAADVLVSSLPWQSLGSPDRLH
jgi:hypothetical protein